MHSCGLRCKKRGGAGQGFAKVNFWAVLPELGFDGSQHMAHVFCGFDGKVDQRSIFFAVIPIVVSKFVPNASNVLPLLRIFQVAKFFQAVKFVEHGALFLGFLQVFQYCRKQSSTRGILQFCKTQDKLIQRLNLFISQVFKPASRHWRNWVEQVYRTLQVVGIAFTFTPCIL
ncbi:MAG: hypothetical protein AUK52_03740 [Comamonadaceae bacterium CG2_30_60_41]|nr:MAG: hypothetical protein AUK52_03740 [Comamonadaceae bacterium CG2_30_60_41]